jgi:hypothetical protein
MSIPRGRIFDKAVCIGCGCDDHHACVSDLGDPCAWLVVDYPAGVGVCSECPDAMARWNAGDREIASGPRAEPCTTRP